MENWHTGLYYCYLLMSTPESASVTTETYMADSRAFLKSFTIEDMRLRPLSDLYFGQPVRADAAPIGNKLRTNMLFFIAILIIGIALVNYINLSIALAPIRTKSITIRKCWEARTPRYGSIWSWSPWESRLSPSSSPCFSCYF